MTETDPAEGWLSDFDTTLLARLTDVAARVPSFGGEQPPWRFRYRRGQVELVLAPAVADGPDAPRALRLAVLSAAAALFNLRLAIGHHGYEPGIETRGEVRPGGVLARVGPVRRRSPVPDDERLHAASTRLCSGSSRTRPEPGDIVEVDDHELGQVIDAGQRAAAADLEITEAHGSALTALDTAMAGPDATGGWRPSRLGTPVRALVLATPADELRGWLAVGQAVQALRLEAYCQGIASQAGVPPDQGRFNRTTLGQILAPGHLVQAAVQLEPASVQR